MPSHFVISLPLRENGTISKVLAEWLIPTRYFSFSAISRAISNRLSVEISARIPEIAILGKENGTLVLRVPRFRDLLAMDAETGDMGKVAALIASCAQVPKRDIEQLSIVDLTAVQEALQPFLDSRKTG